jgi:peptidoglycan hydrolase-like protein with peptidoglycan-binding domain
MYTDYSTTTEAKRASGIMAAAAALCAIAVMCIVGIVGLAITGNLSTHSKPATAPARAHTIVIPVTPNTPSHTVTPGRAVAVVTLQQQLAQLHFYEAPVDGIMGPKTMAAIADVQREAGLPQTGTMNAATQQALDSYLANDLPGSG